MHAASIQTPSSYRGTSGHGRAWPQNPTPLACVECREARLSISVLSEDALRRDVVVPFLVGDPGVASVYDVHGTVEQGLDVVFSVEDTVGERFYGLQLKKGGVKAGVGKGSTVQTLIQQARIAMASQHALGRHIAKTVRIDQFIVAASGPISGNARIEIANRLPAAERPIFWDADELERRHRRYADATAFGWEEVEMLVRAVYKTAETQFQPDYVLTMSGPGSAAACQRLAMDFREIPLLVAVTFPRTLDGNSSAACASYRGLSELVGEIHLLATRWEVFLPAVLSHLPEGARILILDDRVLSGDTQRKARDVLRSRGLKVALAALVAPPALKGDLDFVGRFFDGREYSFPWGLSRGRLTHQT